VTDVAFHPDADKNMLATVSSRSKDGMVVLWDVASGEPQLALPGYNVAAFNPEGKVLVMGGSDGSLRLWHLQKEEEWGVLQGHKGVITSLAFSPAGTIIASGSSSDFGIFIWNTDPGGGVRKETRLVTLHAHTSSLLDLAFNPKSEMMASASFDGSVRIWDYIAK